MKLLRLYFLVCSAVIFAVNVLNAQWVQTNGPHTEMTYSLAFGINSAGDTILYAGTYNGGVFLSTNYGDSWTEIDGGDFMMGDTGFTRKDIRALAVTPNGTGGMNLFAGTDGAGVFLSTNADTNWTAVNNGLINIYVNFLVVRPDGIGGTNLFAGTNGGVFFSTNSGTSWTAVNTMRYYNFVVNHNASGDTILFTNAGNYVLRSTDNGANWTEVNNGLPDYGYRPVTCLAVHDTIVYAGISGQGVYYSLNNGNTWLPSYGGMGNKSVYALAVCGSYLFVGVGTPFSVTGSVWRRPLSEMLTGVEDRYEQKPSDFALGQNYPNPFNPTTVISCQ